MIKHVIALAMTSSLLINPAHACKVIGHSSDGEPLCATTSDGAGQPYTDGRQSAAQSYRQQSWWQRRQRERFNAENEGRAAWANNGQKVQGLPGTISPFVPGSTQDLAWKAERQRRGIQ